MMTDQTAAPDVDETADAPVEQPEPETADDAGEGEGEEEE